VDSESCFQARAWRAVAAAKTALLAGVALCSAQLLAAPADEAPTYQFDSGFLMGSSLGAGGLERFNKASAVDPGVYQVDVFVNGIFRSRKAVEFRAVGQDVVPCLEDAFLVGAGVLAANLSGEGEGVAGAQGADAAVCRPLGQRIAGARASFDLPRLRLDLSIPQALMKRTVRGAVDKADLDTGVPVGFLNYDTNYFRASNSGSTSESTYLGMNFGANAGMWRFRQQSSYSYQNGPGYGGGHWNSIRAYAQRALPSLDSELTLGQSFTSGALFSSVGFEGVQIATDERMLPDSQRGFAPVVRGIAATNARVVVRQGGNEIYQTTVAPGPFVIDDLYPTSFQGDLQVIVTEADGRVSSFTVPFSAVPDSMRPGASRYAATVGRVRDVADSRAAFGELTYQRGLTNWLTANGGLRAAGDYQALLAGAVMGTPIGALGADATYSISTDPAGGSDLTGWRMALSYGQSFQPTGTNFSLASYRYSTGGYREMADALGALSAHDHGQVWRSSSFQLRNQVVANISQSLGSYGQMFLTAGVSDYHGSDKARDTQFQFSYNNSYRSISYGVSIGRQRTGALFGLGSSQVPGAAVQSATMANIVMLTVSVPLGAGPRAASASASVARRSDGGTSYQASVAGMADEAQTLSYGVSVGHESQDGVSNVSGNLQKRLPVATVGASYSQGQGFWQVGASARGAAVVHAGGLTFGPYVSDTFGLVEAQGASGAGVRNGLGARVDGAGFAIVPSLSPYRFNDVALDAQGIDRHAELDGSQQRVAPSAGAVVRLKFNTRTGYPLLVRSAMEGGQPLPLGAAVHDSGGASIGMVGQGGQVYARAAEREGRLFVQWGEAPGQRCEIPYQITDQDAEAVLYRFEAACRPVGP